MCEMHQAQFYDLENRINCNRLIRSVQFMAKHAKHVIFICIFDHNKLEFFAWKLVAPSLRPLNLIGHVLIFTRCRCLDKSQFFPPGRSIWCNNNRRGPTTRPTAAVGGHACCNTTLCNKQLQPIILDYRKTPVKEYIQGGIFVITKKKQHSLH